MPFDQICASLSWHKHPLIPCNTSLKVGEQSRSPAGFPLATWQEPTRSASGKHRKLYSRELSAKLFHYAQDFFPLQFLSWQWLLASCNRNNHKRIGATHTKKKQCICSVFALEVCDCSWRLQLSCLVYSFVFAGFFYIQGRITKNESENCSQCCCIRNRVSCERVWLQLRNMLKAALLQS